MFVSLHSKDNKLCIQIYEKVFIAFHVQIAKLHINNWFSFRESCTEEAELFAK